MKRTIFIFSLVLYFSSAAAQVLNSGQSQTDALFLQVLSVFPEQKVPGRYHAVLQDMVPHKCATMIFAEAQRKFDLFTSEQQRILTELFQRPELPLSTVSPSGQFRIHYTENGGDAVASEDSNANGVPDFVDAVAEAFDFSHRMQVEEMAYRTPADDDNVDGPEFDVYIQNLGQLYGYTQGEAGVPQTPRPDLRSYIVIDNDFQNAHFTTGVPGAQVTAAHEYFHAVQFAYRTLETSDEQFYYEACSVWMEEELYDEINDYYQYLPVFFQRTDIPFNQFDRFFHAYGEGLWNIFLVQRFENGRDIIRRTWEIMEPGALAIYAIDAALQEENSSFANEFAEFAIWNYFTGSRADTSNFYEEALEYPGVRINRDLNVDDAVTVFDSSRGLTHQYHRIRIDQTNEYSISTNVEEPANWRFAAIVRESGFVRFFDFHPTFGQNFGTLTAGAEIVVIPVNLKVIDGPNLPLLNSTFLEYQFTILPHALDSLDTVADIKWGPNPFQPVEDQFFIALNADAQVRIFSADGRLVRDLGDGQAGSFSWDGLDSQGQPVASGVYIVQIRGERNTELKVAVIRD